MKSQLKKIKKNKIYCHETLWFADFSFSIAHSILSGCCKVLYVQGTYLRTVPGASCVLDSLFTTSGHPFGGVVPGSGEC